MDTLVFDFHAWNKRADGSIDDLYDARGISHLPWEPQPFHTSFLMAVCVRLARADQFKGHTGTHGDGMCFIHAAQLYVDNHGQYEIVCGLLPDLPSGIMVF